MGRPLPDYSKMTTATMTAEDARLELLDLMKEKDACEKELASLHATLQSQNAELGQSLIDGEGFPRADIDVYSVRHTRVRVIELRNDVKALSTKIHTLLEVVYARPPETETAKASTSTEEALSKPFARCNGVAPGSPAAQAGLLRNDKIVRFGSVNSTNHEDLRSVADEVQKNENRTVTIDVLRADAETHQEAKISLVLVPKTWSGRGLLGCHIVPI